MGFVAPVKDMLFNIEHLAGWSDVTDLRAFAGLDLSDAEAVLREFGRFCSDVIAPLNVSGDLAGSDFVDGKVVLPDGWSEAYGAFAEMGWQGLAHPEEFGGQGFPRTVSAAAAEILHAANMSFALCSLLTDGAIEALVAVGSEEMKATYLENLISGRWTGTMNLTEPQAGSDLGLLRSRAERQDDGTYKISGTKIFITYGEHDLAENIIHLVLARLPDAPPGVKGISLFLVPKVMVNDDGTLGERNAVICQSVEHKMGIKASPTTVLSYEEATGFIVGEENNGLSYMFEMMNAARYAVGLEGVAISERAYQQALDYARERVQSAPVDGSTRESVTIIHHADVRRMLMRMRALTEGGRAMAAYAAGLQDLARNAETGAARKEAAMVAEYLTPLVKGFCTENAVEVTSLGVQVHGGMGFIEETGAAQHYRDARILTIYEGTTAIQANDLVGRKTLRDGGGVAARLVDLIQATEAELAAGSHEAQVVGKRLSEARAAFQSVVDHLLTIGPDDPNAAYGAGVPYLMLAGNLVAGWQMARALLVAEVRRADDPDFMEAKISTARFYADHILIDAHAQASRILYGSDSLGSAVL